MKRFRKWFFDYFPIIFAGFILIVLIWFSMFPSYAAQSPLLEWKTLIIKREPRIINTFSAAGISDQIEYRKNVGKIPEKDPEDDDLDFWLMVTAPPSDEDLIEEEILGEWELLSQLVQAEAGNQDLTGMRLVVDVVLNRVESTEFPNTIQEVIFQPGQFEVTWNGMFEKAAWEISDNAFKAVEMEMTQGRIDSGILYFSTYPANGKGFWKHGDHWFSY